MIRRGATRATRAKAPKPTLEDFKEPQAQRFAGGNKPFPMNPFFIPKQPISSETKSTIYRLYLDEPETWTSRKLAEQFGLSIARIEAILRLNALQDKFKSQGIPLQTGLVLGMESLLRAQKIPKGDKPSRRIEPIRETLVNAMNPFIQLLDEEEKFHPNDAAKLLQLEPFQNIQKRLDQKAQKVFELQVQGSKPNPIESDSNLKGKFEFMIIDTSSDSREIKVRDKDGDLRSASKPEIWKQKHQKPTKFFM